ncbi:MAG: haloacid dehalogenase-like hydrolase [Verrucomicrobia subdivision 3 bacterium]|nr:haloacid dehalogenase-like hydrolase [Limisphaerales bacterium]
MPTTTDPSPLELLPSFTPRPRATHVVFDFDGTLSWLRHGWTEVAQTVLTPRFPLREGETIDDIRTHLFHEMIRFNGRPTPLFTTEMAAQIQQRGGQAQADELLESFLEPLHANAHARYAKLRDGTATRDDYIIHGGRALLELLAARGLAIIILSGNPHDQINTEAEMLGLTPFCKGHVYGHTDADHFTKQKVLEKLMAEESFTGDNFVMFGDGAAEIEATRNLGGLAIAVCSDEHENGSGRVDEHKRTVLIESGADAIIADYRNPGTLLQTILGE